MVYVAFVRGLNSLGNSVMGMETLRRLLAEHGFPHAATLGASGNVIFEAAGRSEAAARRIGAALSERLGREVHVLVRSRTYLRRLVASYPFRGVKATPNTKFVVTFLDGDPSPRPTLPRTERGVRILRVADGAVFTAYERGTEGNASFMAVLERAFGRRITTRSWDVVRKLADL